MSNSDWLKAGIDLFQTLIAGVIVALVIFWLDERRARRERRLLDFRIASNWRHSHQKESLRRFDLSHTNLSGYSFQEANLEDTNFDGTELWGTDFSRSNLRRTSFRKTKMLGTKFQNAIVYAADFSSSIIEKRKYPDKLVFADFTNAALDEATFRRANIQGVVFVNSRLIEVDFSHAIVQDCDFSASDLTGSQWKHVKRVENCIWKDVKIAGNEANFPSYLLEEIHAQNIKIEKKRRNGK